MLAHSKTKCIIHILLFLSLFHTFSTLGNRVENLNDFLNQYNMCNVHLVLDPVTVRVDSFQVPVFIHGISSQAFSLNPFTAKSFPTNTIKQLSKELKKERAQCIVYFILLYPYPAEGYKCQYFGSAYFGYDVFYPDYILFRPINTTTATYKKTFTDLCTSNVILIDVEKPASKNYGAETFWTVVDHRRISGSGDYSLTRLNPGVLLYEGGYSFKQKETFFGRDIVAKSNCTANNELLITPSVLQKYIGSPFEFGTLLARLKKYSSYGDWVNQDPPLYVTQLHVLVALKYCVILPTAGDEAENLNKIFYNEIRHVIFHSLGINRIQNEFWYSLSKTDQHYLGYNIIFTNHTALQFATCNGVKSAVSFRIYVDAYSQDSWIGILITAFIVIPISIASILKVKRVPRKEFFKIANETFMSSIALLVGLGPNVKDSQLASNNVLNLFRLVFGTWLLITVMIVNAYLGRFTSFILAAPKGSHSWDQMSDLKDFYVITLHAALPNAFFRMKNNEILKEFTIHGRFCDCVKLGHDVGKNNMYASDPHFCATDHPFKKEFQRYEKLRRGGRGLTLADCEGDVDQWAYYSLTPSKQSLVGPNFFPNATDGGFFIRCTDVASWKKNELIDIEKASSYVDTCEKVAVVGSTDFIEEFIMERQNESVKYRHVKEYSTGADGFFQSMGGYAIEGRSYGIPAWKFTKAKILTHLQLLYQFGLLQYWELWNERLNIKRTEKINQMKENVETFKRLPLKLTVNLKIVTVFIIWGSYVSLSFLAFFLESFYFLFQCTSVKRF